MFVYITEVQYTSTLASSPGHSQLFNVARFSACNIEKLGVAWGRGYVHTTLHCTSFLLSYHRKKKTAESERTHGSSAGNLRTAAAALNFKAAFQELKKKGSAISLFSNTPTAGVPPPTPAVGYESKLDAYARSLEFSGTESAGGKSHEGDFSSSDLPRVSPSGISLADEVDGFGKGSEHISLGERDI